jgi:hypothetical protein
MLAREEKDMRFCLRTRKGIADRYGLSFLNVVLLDIKFLNCALDMLNLFPQNWYMVLMFFWVLVSRSFMLIYF